ncbi:hypothetical protein D3C85_1279300 [compost metagenome]
MINKMIFLAILQFDLPVVSTNHDHLFELGSWDFYSQILLKHRHSFFKVQVVVLCVCVVVIGVITHSPAKIFDVKRDRDLSYLITVGYIRQCKDIARRLVSGEADAIGHQHSVVTRGNGQNFWRNSDGALSHDAVPVVNVGVPWLLSRACAI